MSFLSSTQSHSSPASNATGLARPKFRVLMCAPSNTAVDILVRRLGDFQYPKIGTYVYSVMYVV